jgi:hypothetical protein
MKYQNKRGGRIVLQDISVSHSRRLQRTTAMYTVNSTVKSMYMVLLVKIKLHENDFML